MLINVLVYLIIALCVRKRTIAMVSICDAHRAQRRNAILIAWLLAVGGFIAFGAGIANSSVGLGGGGFACLVGGIICGMVRGRLVYATKIDKERLWLGGCGKEFLADLPEWTGA